MTYTLYLVLVWVISLITLLMGGIVGYLVGTGTVTKKLDELQKKLTVSHQPPKNSGPVRPYTQEEKKVIKEESAEKRISELLQ